MRIVTGKYKGRSFEIPHSFKARPTTDFAKENLFNVLRGYMDLEGTTALDLFSGTGSITLEMLSRGCTKVISVESDRNHHRFITECLKKLGEENCTPLRTDVFRFLKACHLGFDIIFADPPYALPTLPTLPDIVMTSNALLNPNGVFILEHGRDYDFSSHPCFIEHRAYGSVNFSLFQHNL